MKPAKYLLQKLSRINCALLLLTTVSTSLTYAQGPIQDRYIVEVRPGLNAGAVALGHGLAPDFVYSAALSGFAGFIPPGRVQALRNDPRVMGVIPDRAVVAFDAVDAAGKPAGGATTAAQIVPAGVQRIGAAPSNLTFTGIGIGVAVVDTGIDFNHADLQPLGTASFSAVSATAQDDNGHGTHVAGIVAARNNSIDVVGVAANATLYAVKVLDNSGSGTDSTVLAGLDWIGANAATVSPNIRVVNMSLGRTGTLGDNPALRTAIQTLANSSITVVVSAGNDCTLEVSQNVPATYPEVLAVASTSALGGVNKFKRFNGTITADSASYFTTDGAFNLLTRIGVTISAPGEDKEDISSGGLIQSTGILSTKLGGGTTRLSGTSMSAPHVTGVVALLWEQAQAAASTLLPESARGKIRGGADRLGIRPNNNPSGCYSFDGEREGILYAPGAIVAP